MVNPVFGGAVLLLSSSEPDPALGERGWRDRQLLGQLTALGFEVHCLVLRRLGPGVAAARAGPGTRALARSYTVVPHPGLRSRFWKGVYGVVQTVGGAARSLPLSWRRAVRAAQRRTELRLCVVTDPALLGLTRLVRRPTATVLDLNDLTFLQGPLGVGGLRTGEFSGRRGVARFARACARLDRVFLPAAADVAVWRRLGLPRCVAVLPYSVGEALEIPERVTGSTGRPPVILQMASDSPEDLEAVRLFRRRVMPRLRQRVPSARYRVVGCGARAIESFADIELYDSLDSLTMLLPRAHVVVFAARSAPRVRPQILEALAYGKAVVATRVAAFGLDLAAGTEAVLVEDAAGFVEPLVELLEDDALRARLEQNAFSHARRRYGRARGLARLGSLLEDLLVSPEVRPDADGGVPPQRGARAGEEPHVPARAQPTRR